ncbi:hypothetical protein SFRURICE_006316 [Spodoptera frugiperda]|uniref:SFRICE_034898 n=1 Tax=Spodoptera frugiperda TaxID=7108 RepID=A0A2H1WL80_SPOFR|nr:hypothetical protein SFRURICE_006316 [Spodoptera frugiperda]
MMPSVTAKPGRLNNNNKIMQEHSYSLVSKPKKSSKDGKYELFQQPHQVYGLIYADCEREDCRSRRLRNATSISENTAFQEVVKNFKTPAQLFLHIQLQSSKNPKSRRFTMD